MRKIWPYLFILLTVIVFFRPFVLQGLLPIPSDTIVGLYHPFRDELVKEYPRGYPFKNFLITDPIRQQYPWRYLSVELEKQFQLPLWNPYNLSGTPLLANQQSAPFYPLNILFFILPFSLAWSLLIVLQPFLSSLFLFLYLRNLKLHPVAAVLGAISFAFCGFAVAWMQWSTLIQVGMWLPLLLLAIDKIYVNKANKLLWYSIYFATLSSSFLAGHLQTFFYILIICHLYLFGKWWKYDRSIKPFIWGISFGLVALIFTAPSWIPVFQFIQLSARDVDIAMSQGWFIPWQHLVQFIAPDFFGNPATLNYWSIFNYGEFVGYIGIIPLFFVLYSLFVQKSQTKIFYFSLVFVSLLFALPTFFANIPILLHIPLLGTAQPTRLLFVTDFALSVLAAYGVHGFIQSGKRLQYPIILLGLIFAGVWLAILEHSSIFPLITNANIQIARHNMYLPTILFTGIVLLVLAYKFLGKKIPKIKMIVLLLLLVITSFDLIRFGEKFDPFVNQRYLFPQDKLLQFLQKNSGDYRVMSSDSRILPPNFSIMYHLQSVEGYDPLYIRNYGEFIAASERSNPDIRAPFGFNRIITPHNYNSYFIDLLGVKYVLALEDLHIQKLTKVYQEGETRVYENKDVLPRSFFVKNLIKVPSKEKDIKSLFEIQSSLTDTATIQTDLQIPNKFQQGTVEIKNYTANKVVVLTQNNSEGFLVLTDVYYPTWTATIDGNKSTIFMTDYSFRGVIVPKGHHTVVFSDSLF